MKETVVITGASSGIGKETARTFARAGWNVAATMRSPEKETELAAVNGIKCYKLDVTDDQSVSAAIDAIRADFGRIDVLVNNAGYSLTSPFEKTSPAQIDHQFDVNVFGVMRVIRRVLPEFRQRRDGCIINVTSMGGLLTLPIYSAYHGTKWALEGFSESLYFELKTLNIRVKTILPGVIKTDFYSRSMASGENKAVTDYDVYETQANKANELFKKIAPGPGVVAKTILKAAEDHSPRLRYVVGRDAKILLTLRKLMPTGAFVSLLSWAMSIRYKKKLRQLEQRGQGQGTPQEA